MDHSKVIEKFYTSFSNGEVSGMTACYHKDIVFQDAAFGKLKGEEAVKMWEMLLSRSTGDTKISFENIQASSDQGSVNWRAEYVYGEAKRKVINNVSGKFKFKDGKIIEHIDSFNFWKWTRQALGAPGYLLGWTPFMKNKVQSTTRKQLDEFMTK